MDGGEKGNILQFAPFASGLDAGFWHTLSKNKLELYRLDESPISLHGFYFNGDAPGLPCRLSVDYTAFDSDLKTPPRCFPCTGRLQIMNTIETFKSMDKQALINSHGQQVKGRPFLKIYPWNDWLNYRASHSNDKLSEILLSWSAEIWDDIISGRAVDDPKLLSRFLLIVFADLKKYHYYYWFAFPCICLPQTVNIHQGPCRLAQKFSQEQLLDLSKSYDVFQAEGLQFQGYFIITEDNGHLQVDHLRNTTTHIAQGHKVVFGFADPCTLDSFPGWPLRNYLCLISYHWGSSLLEFDIVCFRDYTKEGARDIASSLLFTITLPTMLNSVNQKVLGWEKNERQKLGPRMVNLSSSMDINRLAESAVDLNLKLMRWRLLPELDLDKISKTRCLLLGSGTLGCNIARGLMAWGVRTITLIDNSTVSYSNPVRQTLFSFSDSLHGGRPKAEAAADSLKKIFPGIVVVDFLCHLYNAYSLKPNSIAGYKSALMSVMPCLANRGSDEDSTGLVLSIPMPGHHITANLIEETRSEVEKLEQLIERHDVVFLLMDTRESRWLPTLIGAAQRKLVLSAALGFDTFLVLRHGMKMESAEFMDASGEAPPVTTAPIPGHQLGCYFCNDVVAPGNSTTDRTLDQQCTVSRPGLSMVASALAVELAISVLQHPDGGLADADTSAKGEHFSQDFSSPLGLVPHQIRGFISHFHQVMPATRAFHQCTACSNVVVEKYRTDGFEFLLHAFNEPHYLEDLTGLTQMYLDTADDQVWDLSDDESDS